MTNIGGAAADLRNEQAREAVKNFRALLPSLNAYVRALTGNKHARVEVSKSTNGGTDGKTIYMRPPLALGIKVEHERRLCDKRNDMELLCPACRKREQVMTVIYHEISHISYGTFDPVSPEDMAAFTERAAEEVGTKYSRGIVERLNAMPQRQKESYVTMAGMLSPFLQGVLNSLEDARVNARMFEARRGTRIMFAASNHEIFTHGVEQKDGSVVQWKDYPLNMQAIIGLFCKASGYDYSTYFDPQILEDLGDPVLSQLCEEVTQLRGPGEVYALSFKALVRLRELGYCKSERDPEDEEEPEDEPAPEEADPEAGSEPDDADADEADDDEGAGEPEADEDAGGDEDAPEPDDGDGDSEAPEPADGEGEGDGAVDEGEPDDDSVEPGDATTPGEGGDDTDDGPDEEGGVDGEAPEDGAATEEDPGSGEADPDGDEGAGGEPGDAGESSGDGAGANPELGRGPADDEPGEPGEESDDLPGDDDTEPSTAEAQSDGAGPDGETEPGDAGRPDEGGLTDDGESSDNDGDSGGSGSTMGGPGGLEPRVGDTDADDSDEAEADAAPADGDGGDTEVDDSGDVPDEFGGSDAEPIESGTDGEGTKVDRVREDYGNAEDILDDLNHLLGHDDDGHVEGAQEEGDGSAAAKAIDVAIQQGGYFETPSSNISGVREHTRSHTNTHAPRRVCTGWVRPSRLDSQDMRIAIGVDGDFHAPESILGPALMRMRVTFSENKRAKQTHHLKAGKVNPRALGKRAWGDDERLFQRKTRPGKRSYVVVLGVDISGSTMGTNLILEKQVVMAEAELLNRMGITFAIIAHSANYAEDSSSIMMDMYHVKDFDEVWNDKTRSNLSELGPDAANLDGHSMEYYRKMLDRRTETDRILMYHTDGKMPAENHDEELVILQRELKIFTQKRYTCLGVGINTDSPKEHGLDTVMVTETADVVKVIRHLEKRLEQ